MGLIMGLIILGLMYYSIRIIRAWDRVDKNYKALQEKRRNKKEAR